MPFLRLEYIHDNSEFFFANSQNVAKDELLLKLHSGTLDALSAKKAVNIFTATVISKSCTECFCSDLQTLTNILDGCVQKYPSLYDRLNNWISDYCFYFGHIEDAFRICSEKGLTYSFIKDFTLGHLIELSLKNSGNIPKEAVMSFLEMFYPHENGIRYYESNSEIYTTAFGAVIPKTIKKLYSDRGKDFLYPESRTFRFRGFTGLMCGELSGFFVGEYIPFSQFTGLSEILGSVIRYTENILRQALGIKTKIPNASTEPELRRFVVETLKEVLPDFLPAPAKAGRKPKKRTEESRTTKYTENQSYKEPISLNIDFNNAKRLEAQSWRLAELMGGDYGENDEKLALSLSSEKGNSYFQAKGSTDTFMKDSKGQKSTALSNSSHISLKAEITKKIPEEYRDFITALSENEMKILRCIANGGDTDALARSLGGMALGFADSVNLAAADLFGDIVIDTSGVTLKIFPDYKSELCDILKDLI